MRAVKSAQPAELLAPRRVIAVESRVMAEKKRVYNRKTPETTMLNRTPGDGRGPRSSTSPFSAYGAAQKIQARKAANRKAARDSE